MGPRDVESGVDQPLVLCFAITMTYSFTQPASDGTLSVAPDACREKVRSPLRSVAKNERFSKRGPVRFRATIERPGCVTIGDVGLQLAKAKRINAWLQQLILTEQLRHIPEPLMLTAPPAIAYNRLH